MPNSFWPDWSSKPNQILFWLLAILIFILIAGQGINIWNDYKSHYYIGQTPESKNTITISGEGKVTAIPDIAKVSLGLQTEKATVTEAQSENSAKINQLVAALKEMSVEEKDIKTTNYSIYPNYDWNRGNRTLRGYMVEQNVTITIRDLDKVGEIVALAGEYDLNQASSLNFSIDEPEQYRQEARLLALEEAKIKAEALAKAAGVKLGKVVSFSESSAPSYYPRAASSFGLEAMSDKAVAPEIEAGSQEVTVDVSVSFEILWVANYYKFMRIRPPAMRGIAGRYEFVGNLWKIRNNLY